MIIEKISDLHPHGKLVLRPVEATWSNYPELFFFYETRSNIEM